MAMQTLGTTVVHPLVLLNISEHTTRTLAQVKRSKIPPPTLMCGALLGHQHENIKFEAFLSFELKLNQDNREEEEFDLAHFTARLEQLKVIFPSYDFVGWYVVSANSTRVSRHVARLHERIITSYPSALLMVFDAALAESAESVVGGCSLPITVYETQAPVRVESTKLQWYRNSDNNAGTNGDDELFVESSVDHNSAGVDHGTVWASRLVPVRVTLDSGEAERVAVEHVANVSRQTNAEILTNAGAATAADEIADTSRMAVFLASQRNALEMLYRDVTVLKTYVGDVINGRAEFDPDVMQLVQRVLSNKPVMQTGRDDLFELAMSQEETNFQLAAYLAHVTGAAGMVRSVSQRSNAALAHARAKHAPYVSPSQGEGMFGMGGGGMMSGFGGGQARFGRHRGFGGFR
ncbi:hypothetical protein IWW50_002941 [Coemansia erecta]|nr:hypothetical protein GGF43_005169 [Coemansia sp. RSA 2618]KAJ2825243.1 hypothetical protein IWW50_002941 [Coemansia erecta]